MANQSLAAKNDAIVREFLAAWERRDEVTILSLCTADAVWEYVTMPPIVGKTALAEHLSEYRGRPGARIDIRLQVASGDVVFNERFDHLTLKSGRQVTIRCCGVFEIKDDQISAWRDYFDTRGRGVA